MREPTTIWKVLYDFRKPNWIAYGHVLFVEADTEAEACAVGHQAAQEAEPEADVVRVDVAPSNVQQRDRHALKVAAHALWKRNAAAGLPNDPASV